MLGQSYMKLSHLVTAGWFIVVSLVFGRLPALGQDVDSAAVKKLFQHPPRQYSTGPLWVWNDLLTEEQIRDTLRDLAGQSVKQVWVHPRPGLMTPYLSKDWFRLWRVALDEARRLDMNVWIYDENSYPSGFAGGLVPEVMPESRGRGLNFKESKQPPKWSSDIVAVYRINGDAFESVTSAAKAGDRLEDGQYLVATEVRAGNSPWHGDRCYVNLLSPGVTETFLQQTLEPYRHELGAQFGKRIPGVFTDEPNIHPAGALPWSETLAQQFQKRWGYDLLQHLPSLTRPVGDWRKIRHNYFQVLNEQFIEHWSRPYHDYCQSNHLEWTGHYWDHEWPNCVGVPDNMAMYAWHQLPAIDCLMNQYAEHTHAQFGNARMVKELSSVANQLGLRRTLCETYGAGGWDLRFEDMKRIGDWLEVLGVNTLNQHLSYVTLRGARKRDHPQSFSYHEPWWAAYHVSADYFARVSATLSQGEQINHVLVIEPTTTAWMYQGDGGRLNEIGEGFFKLVMALEAAQIEYDLASEDVIARHGGKGDKQGLRVGQREYDTVVLPRMENMNRRTEQLLREATVTTLVAGAQPARLDGDLRRPGEEWNGVIEGPQWQDKVVAAVRDRRAKGGFAIERKPGDTGILFHQRRHVRDGELLFLVNTSLEHPSAGTVRSMLSGAEVWDPYTGAISPYPHAAAGQGISLAFDLPPSGSLLLFLSSKATPQPKPRETLATLTPSGPVEVQRLAPNVLTLDFVDVTAGSTTRSNVYCYAANQFVWKQNGLERDPWDSAVQFKDELISKKFPAGSGFEASYRFTLEDSVPADLEFVLERSDLYSVTCNGRPIQANAGKWWLDKQFGRIRLNGVTCVGENVVTVRARPFTMFHELEPAYLLGSFGLKATDKGFVLTTAKPLQVGKTGWNQQGYPFYSAGVGYTEIFDVNKPSGRQYVTLTNWYGSVAKVRVNGREAGYIEAPPWQCDVTRWIKKGANQVEVTVYGTLKNTLGPHHGNPALGAAWPAGFHKGPASGAPPGDQYSTVAYGLFEPFVLTETTGN